MKTIDDLPIKHHERLAVIEAARLLKERFSAREVILFGSKARGDDDEESDIDLLILTSKRVSWDERKAINDALFDIELAHDVVISTLIATDAEWNEGTFPVLPIHHEISEHGVTA
jgi:predicted nucleotidyltransferase